MSATTWRMRQQPVGWVSRWMLYTSLRACREWNIVISMTGLSHPDSISCAALGGPLFNLLVLPLAMLFKRLTPTKSVARDLAEVAVMMNTLIPAAGLLPIPGLDGGPILKWVLVEHGLTPTAADQQVRKVNGGLSILLGWAAGWSFKQHHWTIGGFKCCSWPGSLWG